MFNVFTEFRMWRERRKILRDMQGQKAETDELARFRIKDELAFAVDALGRADRATATEIWERLRATQPSSLLRTPQALDVMLRLGLLDEATEAMQAGMRAQPGDPYYLRGMAQISQRKNDHEEAVKQFARLRKRFPGVVEGFTLAADSLRRLGRAEEAEALARAGRDRFPEVISGWIEYARAAVDRKDWTAALERWEPVRKQFNWFGAWTGTAEALRNLGRLEEAEALLRTAQYQFGTTPEPLTELARMAEARGDRDEAIRRWKVVAERFPLDQIVVVSVADALVKLEDLEGAEATLRTAVDRFRTEVGPAAHLATLLHDRIQNHAAAADAWAEVHRRAPLDDEALRRGAEALEKAGRTQEAADVRAEFFARRAAKQAK